MSTRLSRFTFLLSLLFIFSSGCSKTEDQPGNDKSTEMEEITVENENRNEGDTSEMENETFTFLALGDSYTIGESVVEKERWPVQLYQQAVDAGYDLIKPKIIARTGWTTDELLKAIEAEDLGDTTFNFVSLLIGVNNQYRGYEFNQYETEFVQLIDLAIDFAGNDTSRVFVVSIPDYGVTPFGQAGDPEKIANELDEYNSYAEQICSEKGIKYFYITDISREAAEDASLIADDNLHPSGKMYKRWVDRIIPWFIEKLN